MIVIEKMSKCLEVNCVVIASPDCRYHAIKYMPASPEDAAVHPQRGRERERETYRELQYLRFSNANIPQVNRYTINMDLLKCVCGGAGA